MHTPTPWKIVYAYMTGDTKFPLHYIRSENSPQSNICHGGNLANAQHIVKCVNSHDALVEALNKVYKSMQDGSISDCGFDSQFIRDALAKAVE